jgi:peptidoglycan/xylan/chitin deacetylase (PgdA/CDA1 family)
MRDAFSVRLSRKIGALVRTRPVRLSLPGGVVSFTFDDFLKSALSEGGAILEKYQARGTYYAALGLAGHDGDMGPLFDDDDLRATRARGHELACHTFSHLDCSRVASVAVVADIAANAAAFAGLLDGFAPENFAYPFGALSLSAKRAVAHRFQSCRGIAGGINRGRVDLANLRGTRIYAHSFDEGALRRLIDENRAAGGWLIFYSHDVAASPSPYGCTPAQLETIVAYAAEKCRVLPVRDVAGQIGG